MGYLLSAIIRVFFRLSERAAFFIGKISQIERINIVILGIEKLVFTGETKP